MTLIKNNITKYLKVINLCISILLFVSLLILSLVGGHGYMNELSYKSILILISGLFIIFFFNKKTIVFTFFNYLSLLMALYISISEMFDFIRLENPRGFIDLYFIKGLIFALIITNFMLLLIKWKRKTADN